MDKDESQGLLKIEGKNKKDENERGEFPSLGNPEIERKIWKFSPSHKKKNRISKEN